jgi:hypothetical protein
VSVTTRSRLSWTGWLTGHTVADREVDATSNVINELDQPRQRAIASPRRRSGQTQTTPDGRIETLCLNVASIAEPTA